MGQLLSSSSAQPRVSVVMLTYNHRPYIEAAVQSVVNQQTEFPFEILLADDCSTDGTREYAFECERRHPGKVRVVTSESNVGARRNLVRSERASLGEYVAYCEGDDFWSSTDKLARQVEFLEKRPDYVMVHTHCHRYLVESQRLLRNSLTVPEGLDDSRAYEDMLLGVRYPLTVTVMARRSTLWEVLDQCPECSDRKWPMGDTQRWLELARRGKVGCIHEPLATTNVLPESAGQSRDSRKRLRFQLAARELQLHYLAKYDSPDALRRRVRAHLAWNLLQSAYEAQDGSAADELFSDYVDNGGRRRLLASWLRWGSRTVHRRRLVHYLVKGGLRWHRLKRKWVGRLAGNTAST